MVKLINNWVIYLFIYFFFFNDTATTEIYTLSLHDALPISLINPSTDGSTRRRMGFPVWSSTALARRSSSSRTRRGSRICARLCSRRSIKRRDLLRSRSEEHTSELQSHSDLVCRLLLEKKKKITKKQQQKKKKKKKRKKKKKKKWEMDTRDEKKEWED